MIKKVGVIGAMEEEVEALREKLENPQKLTKASMDFYSGKIGDVETVIVCSGIGKVNAGICTQILADVFSVDAIINTGIAGSLRAEIDIGDIVISTDALQHDMDATGFGYEPGVIPRMETSIFPADAALVQAAQAACREAVPEIHAFTGRVVSGDQFIAARAVKEGIISRFGGMCTEMEGAAIAQAAWLNHIPFVILRAISDKADDSASMDYSAFEKQAIQHNVALVDYFVRHLADD